MKYRKRPFTRKIVEYHIPRVFAKPPKVDEFVDDYCSNMILITCWMIWYVCILMGFELLVLIVKFGLN